MSNMQRVADSLLTKMRDMHEGLTSMQLDVIIIRNVVDQMTVQLDNCVRLFDVRFAQMSVQLDNSFRQVTNHVTNQFDTIFVQMTNRLDVNSIDMTNRFDQVALQLERLTQQLDEQSVSNERWFIVTVGLNIVIYLCMVYTSGALGYLSLRISKHCNATNASDGHYPETVIDRSDMRIIGEWFEWLVVRPWLN